MRQSHVQNGNGSLRNTGSILSIHCHEVARAGLGSILIIVKSEAFNSDV